MDNADLAAFVLILVAEQTLMILSEQTVLFGSLIVIIGIIWKVAKENANQRKNAESEVKYA